MSGVPAVVVREHLPRGLRGVGRGVAGGADLVLLLAWQGVRAADLGPGCAEIAGLACRVGDLALLRAACERLGFVPGSNHARHAASRGHLHVLEYLTRGTVDILREVRGVPVFRGSWVLVEAARVGNLSLIVWLRGRGLAAADARAMENCAMRTAAFHDQAASLRCLADTFKLGREDVAMIASNDEPGSAAYDPEVRAFAESFGVHLAGKPERCE